MAKILNIEFPRRAEDTKNYAVLEIPADRTSKVPAPFGSVYLPKDIANGVVSATIVFNYKK